MKVHYTIPQMPGISIIVDIDGPMNPSEIIAKMAKSCMEDVPVSFSAFSMNLLEIKAEQIHDKETLEKFAIPKIVEIGGHMLHAEANSDFNDTLGQLCAMAPRDIRMLKLIDEKGSHAFVDLIRLVGQAVCLTTPEQFSDVFEDFIREKTVNINDFPPGLDAHINWTAFSEYALEEYTCFSGDDMKFAIKRTILQGGES